MSKPVRYPSLECGHESSSEELHEDDEVDVDVDVDEHDESGCGRGPCFKVGFSLLLEDLSQEEEEDLSHDEEELELEVDFECGFGPPLEAAGDRVLVFVRTRRTAFPIVNTPMHEAVLSFYRLLLI